MDLSNFLTPALVVGATVFLWRVLGKRIDDTKHGLEQRLDGIERQLSELRTWYVNHLEHHNTPR